MISKEGNVTLRVSANGNLNTVRPTEVYFADGIAHNLISYRTLDDKGYVLGRRGAQCVLETCDGNSVMEIV